MTSRGGPFFFSLFLNHLRNRPSCDCFFFSLFFIRCSFISLFLLKMVRITNELKEMPKKKNKMKERFRREKKRKNKRSQNTFRSSTFSLLIMIWFLLMFCLTFPFLPLRLLCCTGPVHLNVILRSAQSFTSEYIYH